MFNYTNHADAVGTLYQEACVRWFDAMRDGKQDEVKKWNAVLIAIRAAWPDLVAESLVQASDAGKSGQQP